MRWIVFCLLGLGYGSYAQTWQLEIKSKVELWNWKLSTQVEKEVLPLEKATIKLIKSGVVVKEMRSAPDGTFSIMIPPNGVFELLVSYPKCNPKKIIISTQGVPKEVAEADFKPVYPMKGVIMAKPFKGIDYGILKQDLVKIKYFEKGSVFDKDDENAELMFEKLSQMRQQEDALMSAFCKLNREGDKALEIPDCPLARSLYTQALQLIPNEWYPNQQLKKIGTCGSSAKPLSTQTATAPTTQNTNPPIGNTTTSSVKKPENTAKRPNQSQGSTPSPTQSNASKPQVQTQTSQLNLSTPPVLGQYQYDSLLTLARKALSEKQFDRGVEACKKALKIRANDYDASLLLDQLLTEKRTHAP